MACLLLIRHQSLAQFGREHKACFIPEVRALFMTPQVPDIYLGQGSTRRLVRIAGL